MPGLATPGTTGTPYPATWFLDRILSPMMFSASTPGPMKATPDLASARAKSAFSLRKP